MYYYDACTVTYRNGAYVTNTIRGCRASCTHSAEQAAINLGRKLYGNDVAVQQLGKDDQAQPGVTYWRLRAVLPPLDETTGD